MREQVVRPRRPADISDLEELAARVRTVDGYPPVSAHLFPEAPAFVAEVEGRLAGHVALHDDAAGEVEALVVQTTGGRWEDLIVVSRLFVDPSVRRLGIGRRLLDIAIREAHQLGRQPVLDVARSFDAAIALYEKVGWSRIGEVTFRFQDAGASRVARSFVYLGPTHET